MSTYITSNLLLAAFLECGGAAIIDIQVGKRYSQVHLNLDCLSKDLLSEKAGRMSRVIDRVEDTKEWTQLFNGCILGEIEDRYLRLKRRIADERSKSHDHNRGHYKAHRAGGHSKD